LLVVVLILPGAQRTGPTLQLVRNGSQALLVGVADLRACTGALSAAPPPPQDKVS
jgi:hypothetical protein